MKNHILSSLFGGSLVLVVTASVVCAAPTARLVKDFNRDGRLPAQFVEAGGKVFYTASEHTNGPELWVLGDKGEPRVVREFGPGLAETNILFLRRAGDRVVFRMRLADGWDQVWGSAGSPDDTVELIGEEPGRTVQWIATHHSGAIVALSSFGANGQITTLWMTDGTREGTHPYVEIPASTFGPVRSLGNGVVIFPDHNSATSGYTFTVWRTDGTAAGTYSLFGANPPLEQQPMCVFGDRGYFVSADSARKTGIWETDGTRDGSRIIAADAAELPSDCEPRDIRHVGHILVFQGLWPGAGRELLYLNLSDKSVGLLMDIAPGNASSFPKFVYGDSLGSEYEIPGSYPDRFALLGDRLMFSAWNESFGWELYSTDGTPQGTMMVADIVPGPMGSEPRSLTEHAGKVWFSAWSPSLGEEVACTDGSMGGTRFFADMKPGWESSYPLNFAQADAKLYFKSSTRNLGPTAWFISESGDAIQEIDERPSASFGSPIYMLLSAGPWLLQRVSEPDLLSWSWWRTNAAGTRTDWLAGPFPHLRNRGLESSIAHLSWAAGDDHILFQLFVPGRGWTIAELDASDGDLLVFESLFESASEADPAPIYWGKIAHRRYFSTGGGTRFWMQDTLTGEFARISGPAVSSGTCGIAYLKDGFTVWWVREMSSPRGYYLYVADRPEAEPEVLWEYKGLNQPDRKLVAVPGGDLVFAVGGVVWITGRTPGSARILTHVGADFSDAQIMGDRLYFRTFLSDGGLLCATDGTDDGTEVLYSPPYSGIGVRNILGRVNGRLLFAVNEGAMGDALWSTDGHASGTRLVARLESLREGTSFSRILPVETADAVWFATHGPKQDLWRSDGTRQGTFPICGVSPALDPVEPALVTEHHGRVFFRGRSFASDVETWVVDPYVGRPSRLVNVSTRGSMPHLDAPMIAGAVFEGEGTESVLLRGIGPSLRKFGVSDAAELAEIILYQGGTRIAANQHWAQQSDLPTLIELTFRYGAFELEEVLHDSAMVQELSRGAWTLHARSPGGSGLVEIYTSANGPAPVNLSTRGVIGDGVGNLILGFVVAGDTPMKLLLRAVGPGLEQFGVTNPASDPFLELHDPSGATTFYSGDWGHTHDLLELRQAMLSAGAFELEEGSKDSALLVTLSPGAYTAHIGHQGGTGGAALVEVYVVPEPKLSDASGGGRDSMSYGLSALAGDRARR